MSNLPQSEWDMLLRSPMKLAEGVGLRFDSKGGRCLHDARSSRSWSLEPWQNLLLREIEQGASFGDAVRDVIRAHPQSATRGAIVELVGGLRRIGFLKLERPSRGNVESADPIRTWMKARKPFGAIPLHWALNLGLGLAMAAAGGWALSQSLTTPEPPLFPVPLSPENDEKVEPVTFAWEEAADDKVAVRVWCHGVITELRVRDGDRVKSGEVLARVVDPIARETRDDLRTLLGECRNRRDRYYAEGDPVAYLRETKAMARLARELSEWEEQSGSVALRAPIDGKVRRGWFSEAVGGRVSPGEVLLAIEVDSDAADLLAGNP